MLAVGRWRTRIRVVILLEADERPMDGGGFVSRGTTLADDLDSDLDWDVVARFVVLQVRSSQVVKVRASSSFLTGKPWKKAWRYAEIFSKGGGVDVDGSACVDMSTDSMILLPPRLSSPYPHHRQN